MRTLGIAVALVLSLLPFEPAAAQSADEDESASYFDSIEWIAGPDVGRLGNEAEVQIPESCQFTESEGARLFMLATQNPPSGNERGILLCQNPEDAEDHYFVVFSYDASGYVRDDEGKKLDAAKILATIKRGTEAGNKERRRMGWSALNVGGWVREPFYDPATNNLTWSLRLLDDNQESSVNHSVRLLGRGGVMHVDLVTGDEQLAAAVPAFESMLAGFSYVSGQRYAEWRDGDKMAGYGLTALVAGGAGAAAVKLGLFGKLWKMIAAFLAGAGKFIVVAFAAFAAKFRSFFGRKAEPAPGSA